VALITTANTSRQQQHEYLRMSHAKKVKRDKKFEMCINKFVTYNEDKKKGIQAKDGVFWISFKMESRKELNLVTVQSSYRESQLRRIGIQEMW
jgi:hypothetical protein